MFAVILRLGATIYTTRSLAYAAKYRNYYMVLGIYM